MSREWQPGDVASASSTRTQPAFRHAKGWTYSDGSSSTDNADNYDFRPLVVIDPEDREQVEDLTDALQGVGIQTSGWDLVRAGLREFVNPTPSPKLEEPTGRYAVVQAADGKDWIREGSGGTHPWRCVGDSYFMPYSEINATRILHEGVQP